MFSKACEHGIKAMIYIATQSLQGKRVKIGDVVNHSGSPEAFTAKVLSSLTKYNIVNSHTGPYGGFDIDLNQLERIKIIDIVRAIDGDEIFNGCGLGLQECNSDEPCPMHHRFVSVRAQFKKMLEETSIKELAHGFIKGQTVLMR